MNTIKQLLREAILNTERDQFLKKDVENLQHELETKFNVDLFISYKKHGNVIIVSRIFVPKEVRSSGIGTQVMNHICAYADNNGINIGLTPSSDFGGTKSRLIQFYKGFGFKPYKGFEFRETLIRIPQQ